MSCSLSFGGQFSPIRPGSSKNTAGESTSSSEFFCYQKNVSKHGQRKGKALGVTRT
jgi:hypothetical protein